MLFNPSPHESSHKRKKHQRQNGISSYERKLTSGGKGHGSTGGVDSYHELSDQSMTGKQPLFNTLLILIICFMNSI